ncbi:hypothetical protein PBAL39_23182 [Pedobacter sp. BAL39]|uniref:L-histidine N(alpha)-methyltransferase n=1 Tax=Pedobacter sp. BAL39 TaxID=391596 RepID=UPI0001559E44|nr:L-histidine N(alpha)-methyltransferase [Pedobacter sp. BAL39]EDM35962.1 hypothetical protein PBAL39_23182 [Pedobacter sp. BAL39]
MDQETLTKETLEHTISQFFLKDVVSGLSAVNKSLSSKYFYDKHGHALFQQIMQLPEYYLTRCEMDIFQHKTAELAFAIGDEPFDLIELGAGDGTKSFHLLKHLSEHSATFTYMPIDISGNILRFLETNLKADIKDLDIKCFQGDYFEMMAKAVKQSERKKVVLMLGGNLGNMTAMETQNFCRSLYKHLKPGDRAIIGFDLKKHPRTILNAYDDVKGITAAFNLNLLSRINRELDADFDLDQFEHYQTYDPATGECRSYLVSLITQTVTLKNETFSFEKDETIFMEVSRKFSKEDITGLALESGFRHVTQIMDSKHWFTDSVWEIT